MSFDQGFNFRQSSAFAVDGVGETYVIGDTYPTTRDGVTFGWVNGPSGTRDRLFGDRRLAGMNYVSDPTAAYFQVDLPNPMTAQVHLALGDPAFGSGGPGFVVEDNTTTRLTITDSTVTTVRDALSNDYSVANWPTSEQPSADLTFASTTFRLRSATWVGWPNNSVMHLRIVESAGGGGFDPASGFPWSPTFNQARSPLKVVCY